MISGQNTDPYGPVHSQKLVKDLSSLDQILGSASSAINKYKPSIAALDKMIKTKLGTPERCGSQSIRNQHLNSGLRQSVQAKPALRLSSVRGGEVDDEEVLIFDRGSWQDQTELTNVNKKKKKKNNEKISCTDEGDLIKIRESSTPSRAALL